MKLVVTRAALLTALDRVARLAKPGQHPILETVALTAGEGALGIEGTDLVVEMRVACSAEVEAAGAATVPAEAFLKLVKRLPDGEVTLERLDDGRVRVKAKRSQVHFPSLSPDAMPIFTGFAPSHRFALSGIALARLLDVVFAAADEFTRHFLCGVCLHRDRGGSMLCAASADGKILAQARTPLPGAAGMPSVIVGTGAVEEIGRLAAAVGEEPVAIALSERMIEVEARGTRIRAKLIDARYPDYERSLPSGETTTITVETAEVGAAFKRALAVTGDKSAGVRCAIADGILSISTQGFNGAETLERIDVETTGSHLFNVSASRADRVLDALGGAVAEVALHAYPQGSIWRRPGDDSLFCYLMPMLGEAT